MINNVRHCSLRWCSRAWLQWLVIFAAITSNQGLAQTQPVLLTNGKILTLDTNDSIAESVLIHQGRIVSINDETSDLAKSAEVINLDGKTVIPGLYDSHMHFVRATLRPGYDMRTIERAYSIDALLKEIELKSEQVPEGEFITAIGGWDPIQFLNEFRFPTLEEIDSALPEHPFYMHLRQTGPAVTNTVGKAILEQAGIEVSEEGVIPSGDQSISAFMYLRNSLTDEEKERGTKAFIRHANSLGLTAVRDQGGGNQPGAQLFEPYSDYKTLLNLWHEDDLNMRVRLMFISWDEIVGDGTGDSAVEQHLRNNFMGFGDDRLRLTGIGEHVVSNSRGPNFVQVAKLAAEKGWTIEQHSAQTAENQAHIAAFEAANEVASIEDLRWTLTHVQQITPEIAERLKDLGAGVTVQVHRYLNRGNINNNQGGPPLRMLTDMGVPIGGGTDSTNAQPMNPWLSIYYMVSGKNVAGREVNKGQELTRLEALRTYTLGSAWTSKDEAKIGSIEPGKYADLVVLSDDYLDIPEDDIRNLKSVLTLLEGRAVYSDPETTLDGAEALSL